MKGGTYLNFKLSVDYEVSPDDLPVCECLYYDNDPLVILHNE